MIQVICSANSILECIAHFESGERTRQTASQPKSVYILMNRKVWEEFAANQILSVLGRTLGIRISNWDVFECASSFPAIPLRISKEKSANQSVFENTSEESSLSIGDCVCSFSIVRGWFFVKIVYSKCS
ncbi:hypothetical protein AVEN_103785-1 [Araneus ventricosus]|uniref:Uncharacterized protein n=1 Tax=Araneus ventricosus TaxID=182803 RepID=A0A4Y2GKT2_ARAVE|nr:hypothetical protein AVEN_103785-1 [Araneus ventricosus]